MNYGQGFTYRDVLDMTFDEFQWMVSALNKKLGDEDAARKQAAQAARGGRKF